MLTKMIKDFIREGYFDTLSNISLDDSDKDDPISLFQPVGCAELAKRIMNDDAIR